VGHFLLVHQLAATGALAPGARIVSTLSEGLTMNPLAKADIAMVTHAAENARRFSKLSASPSTKVLLALMAIEFSRRAGGAATFNGVMPPTTLTDNVNQMGPVGRALGRAFAPLLFVPVEVGAAVLVWAGVSPDLAGRTGAVFSHRFEEVRLPARARDPEMAAKAWDATETRLGLAPWP
jgi:hypothetical protein